MLGIYFCHYSHQHIESSILFIFSSLVSVGQCWDLLTQNAALCFFVLALSFFLRCASSPELRWSASQVWKVCVPSVVFLPTDCAPNMAEYTITILWLLLLLLLFVSFPSLHLSPAQEPQASFNLQTQQCPSGSKWRLKMMMWRKESRYRCSRSKSSKRGRRNRGSIWTRNSSRSQEKRNGTRNSHWGSWRKWCQSQRELLFQIYVLSDCRLQLS